MWSRDELFKGGIMRYALVILGVALLSTPAQAQQKENDRVQNAGAVMKEILNVPDNIPQELLDKAECVIVLPSVLKFAIAFGGSYGRGVMTCRGGKDFNGAWAAPTMMALEGGSFGFQLGGQATDYVLLVMNPRGADSVLSSKMKLGVGIAAAAGPKGRDASAATDAAFRAEILSYSRSRGLFAGAFLDGSTLRPDNNANQKLYGQKLTAKEIALEGKVPPSSSAEELLAVLNNRSPKHLPG
jgi:lipid-binding SYLF domain-containing protein